MRKPAAKIFYSLLNLESCKLKSKINKTLDAVDLITDAAAILPIGDVVKKAECHTSKSVTFFLISLMAGIKKILFVCIENSNRSQMAQAFAKIYGANGLEAFSAGSNPSGKINPKAISAMKELKYDLSVHDSKSLKEVEQFAPFDVVITMGCGDACPWMPTNKFIDWQIPDPRNMEPMDFNSVRDLIKDKVILLLNSLDQ